MSSGDSVDTAETYGWDTVFGIRVSDANAAIARSGAFPKSFEADDPIDEVSVRGEFGTWQISTGGDGDLVRLAVPLTTATITWTSGSETVAGTAKVDVRLQFLRQRDESGEGEGEVHHLIVSSSPPTGGGKIASVSGIDYTGKPPSFLGDAALEKLLESWLDANIADFNHVFASVNLNAKADKAEFQWLKPTDVAYAYSNVGDRDGDGILAVLCMTQKNSATGLIQQVSEKLIPKGARAGFLISKERLIQNLVLPKMPAVFEGTEATDFEISSTGAAIVNANPNASFRVQHGGKHYTATIQSLELTIVGQELQLEVLTETEVSPGIRAYCQTQNFLGIKLVGKPDGSGRQTLGFFDARPASTKHWTTADPGIEITEEILTIVGIVIALIAGILTDGAALVPVVIIIGLVAGGMDLTTAIIEAVGNGDAPAIDQMILNCTGPITWADAGDFTLTSAALNDSLQMGGNPSFATDT